MTTDNLILVRHGESLGNVAREGAEAVQAQVIDIEQRDPDVDLTRRGESQAAALGRWLADVSAETPIRSAWSSPYVRAVRTCEIAVEQAGLAINPHLDERLRDRELGILDLLTWGGVLARYPEEAERRRHLGKMYYRPPGGESWSDVALRLRSFLADRERTEDVERPGADLIVTHDAVILLMRYVLEELTERELLDLAAHQSVGNASVTWLTRSDRAAGWELTTFGANDHLSRYGSEPTTHGAEHDAHPH
ncbi:MAG: 2,3-bisphosphoglycerate-dependent phosphoglycerate mutase [Pseudonocardiales bacterium]|nr:2,3-bisphosphoglycerate-dependent phosphoglycerate mutase [Pseudonocardiales bacterium]